MDADRFAELDELYADLSSNGQWLLDEVRRLRKREEELLNELDDVVPLSDLDRVNKIVENVSGKVYDRQAREDITWLVQQLGATRSLIKSVNRQLGGLIYTSMPENTREIINTVAHHLRGNRTELAEVHDLLAEVLGYQKAPTLEEDPNCPCPGQYITGDHIAVTLAMEATRLISNLRLMNAEQQKTIQGAMHTIDELSRRNRRLTGQLRQAIQEGD